MSEDERQKTDEIDQILAVLQHFFRVKRDSLSLEITPAPKQFEHAEMDKYNTLTLFYNITENFRVVLFISKEPDKLKLTYRIEGQLELETKFPELSLSPEGSLLVTWRSL